MDFPETWGTLLLNEDPGGDLEAFCARLKTVTGVSASPGHERLLTLPGGFLAVIERGACPRDLFDQPAATGAPERLEPVRLHLSGGGYEPDNLGFAAQAGLLALGREPRKTSRFTKVESFTGLVSKLMPLAEGCVLPMSGYRFVPASEWPATQGAGEVFGNFLTLSNCYSFFHTRGMRYFALPEVGLAIPPGADEAAFNAVVRRLFDVAFEIAWQGFQPPRTMTLKAFVDRSVPECEVRPLSSVCTWLSSPADAGEAADEWTLRAHLAASLKAQYVFDEPEARREHVKVAAFARAGGRVLSTAGLHLRPRHGMPGVEVLAYTDAFYPGVAQTLGLVADNFLLGAHPVKEHDRLVMPALESRGLAGVILWSCGHVNTSRGRVETWDALPFTPAELQDFRAGGQQAWLKRVADTNAFEALHARWKQLAPALQ